MGNTNQCARGSPIHQVAQPGFARIATPLTNLTRGTGAKGRPIAWTDACTESFQMNKDKLTSAPILRVPAMHKPFRIETEASDFGIGIVLLQPDDQSRLTFVICNR